MNRPVMLSFTLAIFMAALAAGHAVAQDAPPSLPMFPLLNTLIPEPLNMAIFGFIITAAVICGGFFWSRATGRNYTLIYYIALSLIALTAILTAWSHQRYSAFNAELHHYLNHPRPTVPSLVPPEDDPKRIPPPKPLD